MNIRQCRGRLMSRQTQHPPTSGPFRKRFFLPWGCSCPRPTWRGLGSSQGAHEQCLSIYSAVAVRRSSAPAAPSRWTATPRPASWPTRRPGAPGTSSRANTRARSPAPSWRCWRRCYGASTTPAPAAASRAMRRSPPGRSAPAAPSAEALKALEWAGVLTWQNRITRIQVRERDLFGHGLALAGHPHLQCLRLPRPESRGQPRFSLLSPKIRPGTLNQEFLDPVLAPAPVDPDSPLERALRQLGDAIEARLLMNGSGGPVPAS